MSDPGVSAQGSSSCRPVRTSASRTWRHSPRGWSTSQPASVGFATSDGTARASLDYDATNGTVSFAAGETTKIVEVRVRGDLIPESNGSFFVALSSPVNAAIGNERAVGTIVDDDDKPRLNIDDVTVQEPDRESRDAVFTVTLAPASEETVTVRFATSDGSALMDSDYLGDSLAAALRVE